MAKLITKVNELPLAKDPTRFEIPGFDETTNAGAKARMSDLKGDTGPAPNITVRMVAVAYGTTPSVDKAGTETDPEFTIRFPLAANGKTPLFRNDGIYIQYRYADTEQWQNIVALDDLTLHFSDLTAEQVNSLKLKFSDLTDAEIALLQKPATDAAKEAKDAADRLNALSDHPAQIRDGYWWLWNEATGEYENSGERADGNTLFAAFDIDLSTGELSCTTPDRYDGPQFAIDTNGNLNVRV